MSNDILRLESFFEKVASHPDKVYMTQPIANGEVGVDLGSDTIDGLGSPESKDVVMPAFALELGYTFANKKTRILLGTDFSNFLQFDRSTRFAIRHDFGRPGTLQLAYLTKPGDGRLTEMFYDRR
ncbi:MAG: DUF2860 family protein [Gammaproteobacteria bacterium]|nr:DUF2860 family protein [Gammaproteobacteria bacterium]